MLRKLAVLRHQREDRGDGVPVRDPTIRDEGSEPPRVLGQLLVDQDDGPAPVSGIQRSRIDRSKWNGAWLEQRSSGPGRTSGRTSRRSWWRAGARDRRPSAARSTPRCRARRRGRPPKGRHRGRSVARRRIHHRRTPFQSSPRSIRSSRSTAATPQSEKIVRLRSTGDEGIDRHIRGSDLHDADQDRRRCRPTCDGRPRPGRRDDARIRRGPGPRRRRADRASGRWSTSRRRRSRRRDPGWSRRHRRRRSGARHRSARLDSTKATMASTVSVFSTPVSWASIRMPNRSSRNDVSRMTPIESTIPLVRSGRSSARLPGILALRGHPRGERSARLVVSRHPSARSIRPRTGRV